MINWTKEQAKAYLVNYHMINTKHHYSVNDVFTRLNAIQYDPLNVVGTNPELVLQSRVSSFKKEILYNALYKDRYLIDGWDKQMCIYHIKDYDKLNLIREDRAKNEIKSSKRYLDLEFEHIIDDVFNLIDKNGPILSSKIKLGDTVEHKWRHTKASSAAISYLFHKGDVGIESRHNTQKKYHTFEKLHPNIKKDNPFSTLDEFIEYHLYRRIQSMGLVWSKYSVAFSGLYIYLKKHREKFLKVLIDKDMIKEVKIDGISEIFYIPTTALSYPVEVMDQISFLAPLDNMLWDRALILKIFDFDYTWEVYVPQEKRKYGYYVLPILKGSDLIGRIEFDKQRKNDPLKVIHLWLEPQIKMTKKLKNQIDKALVRFSNYLETNEIDSSNIL
ncbi:MAG: winged helix DNA-binding domain-containing protein [Acholeplasmataceae bacterium]|nr:winged helix DNA-binding domain-containing protein [Acholeplasmataceae bacterium]